MKDNKGIPLNNIRPDGQVTDGPGNMLDTAKVPTRQEQIDKICFKFLKWDRTSIGVYMDGTESWYWRDLEKKQSISRTFDPFTNPADCHTVMQEVVKRGWLCEIHLQFPELNKKAWGSIATETKVRTGYGESWMEAFCSALLDAIE